VPAHPGTSRRGAGAPVPLRASLLLCAATVIVACLPLGAAPRVDPDYYAIYNQGVTFADFLESARARRDEWRERYKAAAVTAEMVTRMRALQGRRLILVVAEDWCGDSAQSVPYIARLVDAGPERLSLRIVNSTVGRPVMDANLTPDGRAATPTVVVLREQGGAIGSWVERPSRAQAWFLERQKTTMQGPLHEELMKWYADDAGRTTVAEIAALVEG
jgi:thioredoxin family protein